MGPPVPEALFQHRVVEVFVLRELPADADGPRIAGGGVVELEMAHGEGGEGGQQQGGVGGLDVLVYVGGGLLEDEGPEVGDLRDGLVPPGVERGGEVDLLADCRGRGEASISKRPRE